jgi:flagellar biosynthesis protein FlhA
MLSKIPFPKKGFNELALVCCMVGILLVLFTPVPAGVLDFLLLLNFSIALLILLITFYTEKPTEFSTFPSLLLITTLFRLALNISATRLILANADAGAVIGSVGEYVVGGNYVIGLVVFLILIVVQYVVVTNGAQRVAEVAARFILDSLPGKQMSIDADLNMGIITQEEAQKRRSDLERESNFYGAMDGASKFVKGDAIAGIIIVLIDIIGGLSIGLIQMEMSWSEAVIKFTLLTVGDGIVTQIPSLIIAVGTGIIITRAATDSRLGDEVVRQFARHPKTIVIAGVAMLAFGFLPGIPVVPILVISCLLFTGAWFAARASNKAEADDADDDLDSGTSEGEEDLYRVLAYSDFEVRLGSDLKKFFKGNSVDFERRLTVLRKTIAQDLGLVLPNLVMKQDSKLGSCEYSIFVYGDRLSSGEIMPDRLLAISPTGSHDGIEGVRTNEPTYGLPALWIEHETRSTAADKGFTIVEPDTVLITHLQEICKRDASKFVSRAAVEKLVEAREAELGAIVEEIIPAQLSYSDIQSVLRGLLDEGVPIRNLRIIFETLADVSRTTKDIDLLTDKCREGLKSIICENLSGNDGKLHVITISSVIETRLLGGPQTSNQQVSIPPQEVEPLLTKLVHEVDALMKKNITPVLLCAGPLRRVLKNFTRRAVPQLKVLSINEIDERVNIVSAAVIDG